MNKFETMSFSGKSINCYGLEIVSNNLIKNGYKRLNFDEDSNNVILFSCYWPEQIYDFIKWRYNKKLKGRRIIVGGNTATVNPSIFLSLDCDVFLGDGENLISLKDNTYILNKDTKQKKNISIIDRINPIAYEDTQTNRRAFVEMSRGCKNKCLFCQYGWLKKYRESNFEDLKQIIKRSKTKSIRMFAADRFQHTKYLSLRKYLKQNGKCDTGSDVSLKFVNENPEYLKYTTKVRVGIEGMSYRLRKLIGKNYTDEDIIDFSKKIIKSGIKCFDWYMIYGLPTENEQDILMFKDLLSKLDKIFPENYALAIHWNAFSPSPMTPFQREAVHSYKYKHKRFMQEVLFTKKFNKNIKIMHKPKFTGDNKILIRMLATRATGKTKHILNFYIKNKALFMKNHDLILNEYKKVVGVNLMDKWPENKLLPWDDYVNYDKNLMEKVYKTRLSA